MSETSQPNRSQKLLSYLACYALFGLLLVLGYFVGFVIWWDTVALLIGTFTDPGEYRGRTIGRVIFPASMLLLGTGLFIFVLVAEPYLRNGIQRRQLLIRFARLAVPLGLFGILGLLLQLLLT